MTDNELVFAYGSNMDPNQMRERCPASDLAWFIASARGFKLVFPRESINRRCGVGSIQPEIGETVWGVVFAVSQQDLPRLDEFEGVGSGAYERNKIVALDELNVAHTVWTYFAKPMGVYQPSPEYLTLYVRGATYFGLPADYIARLEALLADAQSRQT